MGIGRLSADPTSPARGFAEGLAWLWRLGEVEPQPARDTVAIGVADEADGLASLARSGAIRGAVVFANGGESRDSIPRHDGVRGIARSRSAA